MLSFTAINELRMMGVIGVTDPIPQLAELLSRVERGDFRYTLQRNVNGKYAIMLLKADQNACYTPDPFIGQSAEDAAARALIWKARKGVL